MSMRMTKVQHKKLDRIQEQVNSKLLPKSVQGHIDLARQGDLDRNNLFKSYERMTARGSRIARSTLLMKLESLVPRSMQAHTPADPSIVYQDTPDMPVDPEREPPDAEELPKTIKAMARDIDRPQDTEPLKIIKTMLGDLGFTPATAGYRRAFELASVHVARSLAFKYIRTKRRSRHAPFPIPPMPASKEFARSLAADLATTTELIEQWQDWDGWPMVLIDIFTVILADGVFDGHVPNLPIRRKAEIALKAQWFEELKAWGMEYSDTVDASDDVGSYDVARSAWRLYYRQKEDEDARRKIAAEYSRLDKSVRGEMEVNGHAVRRFYLDMLELHREGQYLMGDEFMELITPYVRYDSVKELMQMFDRRDVPQDVNRIMAKNIIAWHAFSPQGFAGWLAGRVSEYKRDVKRDLNAFCLTRLGFTRGQVGRDGRAPEALVTKLMGMSKQGADLTKLIQTINRRFPGAISKDVAGLIKSAGKKAAKPEPKQAEGGSFALTSPTRASIKKPNKRKASKKKSPPKAKPGGGGKRVRADKAQMSMDFGSKAFVGAGGVNRLFGLRSQSALPGASFMLLQPKII